MKQRWTASGVAVRLGWAAVVLLSIGSGSCGPEEEVPPDDDDTVPSDDDTLPPDDDTAPPDDDTVPPDDDTTEGEDRDGDGYSPPEDCNDYSSTSYPGAPELCDELDNDCNGIVEDNIDADGDGRSVCDDCDDTDPLVHPGASDVWCDGIDQDCISGDLCGPASWVSLELAEARIDGGERVTDCYPYEEVAVGIGDSLAGVGDVDGDGFADFAVGNEDVFGFDCVVGSGGAFIFRGPISGVHSVFEAFGAVLGRPVPPPYGDGAGQALAGGEDLTGDGVPDLLVGASLMNEEGFEAGGAILVSGDLSSTNIGGDTRLYGAAESDSTGLEVAFVGDVTGEGFPDIAVASASHDLRGAVYIVPGPVGAGTYALLGSGPLLVGAEGDGARAPSGGGDLNGDGYADVAVRASGNDEAGTSYGAVYVVFGPVAGEVDLSTADAKWLGEEYGHLWALAPTLLTDADVNGDGYDDLVVGAPSRDVVGTSSGTVHVILGPLSPGTFSLASADLEWQGEAELDFAGAALATLGDIDGDGRDEIAVGAPEEDSGGSNAGAVHVVDGEPSGVMSLADAERKIYGTVAEAWAGQALAPAGDVNGDGHMDLLVGAKGWGAVHGSVYLVPGGPGGML